MLLVTVAVAAVLALAAGARRTATAPERLTRELGGDGLLVTQQSGRPRTAEVTSLHSIQSFTTITYAAVAVDDPGHPDAGDINAFAGAGFGLGGRLVAGRRVDPSDPTEFVSNVSFARAHDAHVGQQFAIRVLSQEELDRSEFGPTAGVATTATLVGIVDSPDDLDDPTPTVLFSPALLDRDVGVVTTFWFVHLRTGDTSADLRAELDSLPAGSSLGLDVGRVVSGNVRTSVDGQAKGLWVLTLVGAAAVIVTLGQLLLRSTRRPASERASLTALGMTHRELMAEGLLRSAISLSGGVLLGAVVAAAGSGIFPTGFVRRVEPNPGMHPDLAVLGIGAAAFLVLLLAWVAVGLRFGGRPRSVARNSQFVDSLATHAPTTAASTGVRFGLGRHERDTVTALGASVGLIVAMAGVIGASLFWISVDRLVDDGNRFGNNYDLVFGNGWFPPASDFATTLGDDPAVRGLVTLGAGFARSGGDSVELIGFRSVRGGMAPVTLKGRLPVSQDEVALGRLTANHLGARIGDTVTLQGDAGPAQLHVVGFTVLPSLGINTGVGNGAVLTMDGLRAIVPSAIENAAGVVLTKPARRDFAATQAHLATLTGDPGSLGTRPAAIQNAARLRGVPVALVSLLAALGLVALVYTAAGAVRDRRHDLGILRALGADRRHISRVVRWQATVSAAVPVLLGIPLGLVGGRLVFRAFAEHIGAVPTPSIPTVAIAIGAAGFVVFANVAALAASSATRRLPAGAALRTE